MTDANPAEAGAAPDPTPAEKRAATIAAKADAEAAAAPRFVIRLDALIDTKGKGRWAPIPGVTQALADECNANPDRFDHFGSVSGLPPEF